MQQLLKTKGFLPFVLILFLNAFVDLGHKIIVQNTVFKIYDGQTQIVLTALVNGLILLPFLLLFSAAGFLADRHPKPRIIRVSAAVAVGLTLLITLSYYLGWFQLAFGMTFLLAVQSAIYSPAKYGFIKELSGKEQLAKANGVVQAVTIVAILIGIFVFSILFEWLLSGIEYQNESQLLWHIAPVGWLLVICSLLEYRLALRLPPSQVASKELHFDWPTYRRGGYLRNNLALIFSHRTIWLSIVGLAIFWGISQVVLAAFPAHAKGALGEENTVIIQGLLACSGIGIIIGSLIAGGASKRHIETGLIPLGALGVVTALFLLPQLKSLELLALDFILMGASGGIFIVPLNALIQFHAKEHELGTVLAGNNWVQNLVMLGFLLLSVLFVISGSTSLGLFHLLTLTALGGALYTLWQLPQSLVRYVISRLFMGGYRVEVLGFENLPAQGGVLMLGNHISYLDWAMVQIACPRPVRFVMHRSYYQRWYLKWFLDLFGVIPIASGKSKQALAEINRLLKAGEVVCLFPEGAISRNGQLGEFKRGYERAAEGVDAIILPFYLRGLWGSRFSRSSEKLQQRRGTRLRTEVIVAFGPPLPIDTPAHELKQQVFDLSIDAWEQHTRRLEPLPLAWLRSAKRIGDDFCLADALGDSALTGHRVTAAVFAISRLIRQRSPERNIGLLMPTGSAGIIANLACLLLGKTVVNLNHTASPQALRSAIEKAKLENLYTSRLFIETLALKGIDIKQPLGDLPIHYLEDMQKEIGKGSRLLLLAVSRLLPARVLYALFGKRVHIEQPAAIVFSRGSEGEAKGVVLSHRNIMGNISQVFDVLDTREEDLVMASLPLCHAFGLIVTGLMPLVEGIPLICHSDPGDALTIAQAIGKHRATLFCGTSSFLRRFTHEQQIHPLMLASLRLVVAGAERLDPEVRDAFKLKFNKDIYEGYGTTETTPVASVNIPDRIDPRDWRVQEGSRPGSVGLPLPGSSFRIVDPQTLRTLPPGEEGLILIGGTQIMLGYLDDPGKTAEVMVELDGKRWYKSGDKGHLDRDGFLTIVDRYTRFTKMDFERAREIALEGDSA